MNAVEIFTPHFSEAIAQSIAHSHKLGTPLHVMEVASGSTTNLSVFLSYMKKKLPNVYKNMKYYLLVDDVYFKPLSIPEEFAEKVIIKDIVYTVSLALIYVESSRGVSSYLRFCLSCDE